MDETELVTVQVRVANLLASQSSRQAARLTNGLVLLSPDPPNHLTGHIAACIFSHELVKKWFVHMVEHMGALEVASRWPWADCSN